MYQATKAAYKIYPHSSISTAVLASTFLELGGLTMSSRGSFASVCVFPNLTPNHLLKATTGAAEEYVKLERLSDHGPQELTFWLTQVSILHISKSEIQA